MCLSNEYEDADDDDDEYEGLARTDRRSDQANPLQKTLNPYFTYMYYAIIFMESNYAENGPLLLLMVLMVVVRLREMRLYMACIYIV